MVKEWTAGAPVNEWEKWTGEDYKTKIRGKSGFLGVEVEGLEELHGGARVQAQLLTYRLPCL
jgi:hypothetical protein